MKTNTLEILQKTGLQADTAHAIYNAMEVEMAAQAEGLATRGELAEAIHSFHLEIQGLRQDMLLGFAGMKAEIGTVRGEFKTEIQSLRAEMKGIEGKLARWVVTCAIALAGAIWAALHLR